LFWERIYRKKN